MRGDPGGYVWGDRAGQGPHAPTLCSLDNGGYMSVLGGNF